MRLELNRQHPDLLRRLKITCILVHTYIIGRVDVGLNYTTLVHNMCILESLERTLHFGDMFLLFVTVVKQTIRSKNDLLNTASNVWSAFFVVCQRHSSFILWLACWGAHHTTKTINLRMISFSFFN